MAEELMAVKIDFVDSVTSPVISQLLSHLSHDKVLNSGEEEDIREAKDTRADKARSLIDFVCKKGDEAAWKAISYIKLRDPTLFESLGLPERPQAASEEERQWSDTLIPCKWTFWNSKKNDSKIYPVTKESMKSRVALLITNITFKDKSLDRDGAEVDERNMEKLLRALGYEVVKYTNRTGKEIDEAVINFSQHPKLENTDSVFVVIMSHGILGYVLGVNWKKMDNVAQEDVFAIDNIYQHLASAKCKALQDKPKIIIIQACRGKESGSVLISDGAEVLMCDNTQQAFPATSGDDGNIADDGRKFVHKEDDFSTFLSCTPDTVSYRHTQDGALLIQYLVAVVNTCACEDDIEELYRIVMRRFKRLDLGKFKQMPTKARCTLSRRFYLFPGI
ncbi:caspase a-like isoform X2 [Vanacampus margaritifer]